MKQSKKNKQPTNVDIAAADERASTNPTVLLKFPFLFICSTSMFLSISQK